MCDTKNNCRTPDDTCRRKKSAVAEMFDFKDYSTFYRSYVKIIEHTPGSIEKH